VLHALDLVKEHLAALGILLSRLLDLGACRNNAKRPHPTAWPSHFRIILASAACASSLKMSRSWGSHPTFSGRHDFSDRLLEVVQSVAGINGVRRGRDRAVGWGAT
jgi:hypothetical protein